MTTAELHWLAGILEGEGCFHLQSKKSSGVYIQISMNMTDEDVVRKAQKIAGVGKVYGPYQRKAPSGAAAKQVWLWQVMKQADAAALMMTLYPLMGQRRQNKITELLAVWRAN